MPAAHPVTTDMNGKVCLVTGANTGIGKVTSLELARAGAHVVLACRSKDKADSAMNEIRDVIPDAELSFLALDLGSLSAVRTAAARFIGLGLPLHVLVNNAGLAGNPGETEDGFEQTFGVNHLGHFLFTNLLLERLEESAPSRVVIVASKAHYDAKTVDWQTLTKPTTTTTGFPEYTVSKLCNVLHARELARRLSDRDSGVLVCSVHPGVVASDIWRRIPWPFRAVIKWFMISNEDGALTTLHCATSPHIQQSGLYYDERKARKPSALALDDEFAAELWRRSEEWVAVRNANAAG